MNIEDVGLEVIKHPITQVRVQPHAGRWYVEYRRKPRYFFDKWWWFDDSIFTDFRDAYNRAQILAADGGVSEVKQRTIEISVKDYHA